MKKSLFLLSALALALGSCSSDEPTINDQQAAYEEGNGYMTFNIVSPATGTRADETPKPVGEYLDGSEEENNVKGVRFYFFDKDGNPFGVHKHLTSDVYDSYIDWYPIAEDITDGNEEETVEENLRAAIELNLAYDKEGNLLYPTQVLAIINPTNEILSLGNQTGNLVGPTLQQLQANVTDYKTGLTNYNFVMSNSVYVNNFGQTGASKVVTTSITEGDIYTTAEEARKNPVTLYVERVVARVDFTISEEFVTNTEGADPQPVGDPIKLSDGTLIYPIGEFNIYSEKDGTTVQETETLYIKFLGWNVTAVANQSRLIKDINPLWTNESLFGSAYPGVGPWTTSDYHRSFWALNPDPAVNQQFAIQYGQFTTEGKDGNYYPALGNKMPVAGDYTKLYIQENANPFSDDLTAAKPTEPTKLIVGAQIVDAEGEPVTIGEWMSHKYTPQAMLTQMVKTLMTQQPEGGLYYTTVEDGKKYYNPITVADLEFTTVDPATGTNNLNDPDYYVYVTLKKNVLEANRKWCLGTSGSTESEFANNQAVINYIREVLGHAMIWNTGYTYYYNNIRHLGYSGNGNVEQSALAAYGIVRNHIYRIYLNSVAGLGCPVYDPDRVIKPEESAPAEAVLSADIKILQWRIVSQKFDLTW